MFGLKLSVRGHQHVFQLEIPELQAFHGKIELGPEIIIMAHSSNFHVKIQTHLDKWIAKEREEKSVKSRVLSSSSKFIVYGIFGIFRTFESNRINL